MTTRKSNVDRDDMRTEYDLSKLRGATRGKYYVRASTGTNLVLIDPDLVSTFPDAKSVNDALRVLVNAAKGKVRRAAPRPDRSIGRSKTGQHSPPSKRPMAKSAQR
jgi:hypothetical protein